jgi:hypothetical protein
VGEDPSVPGEQPGVEGVAVAGLVRGERRRLRESVLSGGERRRQRGPLEVRRQREGMLLVVVHHLWLQESVLGHQVGVVGGAGSDERVRRDAGHHDGRFGRRRRRALRRPVQPVVGVAGRRQRRRALRVVDGRLLGAALAATADDRVDREADLGLRRHCHDRGRCQRHHGWPTVSSQAHRLRVPSAKLAQAQHVSKHHTDTDTDDTDHSITRHGRQLAKYHRNYVIGRWQNTLT